jgi:hypothetical protein
MLSEAQVMSLKSSLHLQWSVSLQRAGAEAKNFYFAAAAPAAGTCWLITHLVKERIYASVESNIIPQCNA